MAVESFEPAELHPVESVTHLYRVTFWHRQTPPAGSGIAPDQMGWAATICDVTAEDVHEVIAWADEEAGDGRIYTLYVRLEEGCAPGRDVLVHVAGADPTHNRAFDDGFYRQHPLR